MQCVALAFKRSYKVSRRPHGPVHEKKKGKKNFFSTTHDMMILIEAFWQRPQTVVLNIFDVFIHGKQWSTCTEATEQHSSKFQQ